MITEDLIVPAALALVALLLAVLVAVVVVSRRDRGRAREELRATTTEAAQLRARVEDLARRIEVRETPQEFVITQMGADPRTPAGPDDQGLAGHINGRLFADIVLRESVLKAASLTHGVRRALAPETRNRIRFAMKQETKRSRRERRIAMREVRRELAQRQRSARSQRPVAEPGEEGAA